MTVHLDVTLALSCSGVVIVVIVLISNFTRVYAPVVSILYTGAKGYELVDGMSEAQPELPWSIEFELVAALGHVAWIWALVWGAV